MLEFERGNAPNSVTQAAGVFSNCGPGVNTYQLDYKCTGPACSAINGFQQKTVECNPNGGSILTCSNNVKCPAGISSYMSNFTFTQNDGDPWNPTVQNEDDSRIQQVQQVMVPSCAKFSLTSDGTKEGTNVVDDGKADPNVCPKVKETPSPTAGSGLAKKTSSTSRAQTSATSFSGAKSAASRGKPPRTMLLFTFFTGLMTLLPGTQASVVHDRRDDLRRRAALRVRDVSDKVRKFAQEFGSELAGRANAQGQNGEVFAHNLVADVISSVCDAYFSGQDPGNFTPFAVKDCVKSIYGGEKLPQAAGQFFAVFGASLLCDYTISEAYPVAQEFFPDGCEGLQDLARKISPKATAGPSNAPSAAPSLVTNAVASPPPASNQATNVPPSNAPISNAQASNVPVSNVPVSNVEVSNAPTPLASAPVATTPPVASNVPATNAPIPSGALLNPLVSDSPTSGNRGPSSPSAEAVPSNSRVLSPSPHRSGDQTLNTLPSPNPTLPTPGPSAIVLPSAGIPIVSIPGPEPSDNRPAPSVPSPGLLSPLPTTRSPPAVSPPIQSPAAFSPTIQAPLVQSPPFQSVQSVQSPLVQSPPVQTPSVQIPPVQTPVVTPSGENPPSITPPVRSPPVRTPSIENPPSVTPSIRSPSSIHPPQSPPSVSPPAQIPPAESPSVRNPTATPPNPSQLNSRSPVESQPTRTPPVPSPPSRPITTPPFTSPDSTLSLHSRLISASSLAGGSLPDISSFSSSSPPTSGSLTVSSPPGASDSTTVPISTLSSTISMPRLTSRSNSTIPIPSASSISISPISIPPLSNSTTRHTWTYITTSPTPRVPQTFNSTTLPPSTSSTTSFLANIPQSSNSITLPPSTSTKTSPLSYQLPTYNSTTPPSPTPTCPQGWSPYFEYCCSHNPAQWGLDSGDATFRAWMLEFCRCGNGRRVDDARGCDGLECPARTRWDEGEGNCLEEGDGEDGSSSVLRTVANPPSSMLSRTVLRTVSSTPSVPSSYVLSSPSALLTTSSRVPTPSGSRSWNESTAKFDRHAAEFIWKGMNWGG